MATLDLTALPESFPGLKNSVASLDTPAVHMAAISALEEADLLLAEADVKLAEDAVYTMDKVTPEWLSKVLGAHVPGAKVVKTSIAGGHEGMTSRHRWKLEWNSEGQKAGLPTAIFFKATPEGKHLREMLSLLHMGERECDVYNKIQRELRGLIPKGYYAHSYPGGRHIIILEDVMEVGATPHWMADVCSIKFAKAVAVSQAKLHSKFWNSDRFEKDMVWVRPHSRGFGWIWQKRLYNNSRRMFLDLDVGKELPDYVRNLIKQWDEQCVAMWEYFDRKPPTILHGDSHLGNVMENADGTASLYDWQCHFRGYGYRDLAYFTMSALTVEDCEAHERDIFDVYTNTLEEHGISVNREEAWREYCLLGMERFDSAMVSLTNGGYGHAKHALLRQVRTCAYKVQKYDVAALLDRVAKTGSI